MVGRAHIVIDDLGNVLHATKQVFSDFQLHLPGRVSRPWRTCWDRHYRRLVLLDLLNGLAAIEHQFESDPRSDFMPAVLSPERFNDFPELNRLRSWTGQDFCSALDVQEHSRETCTSPLGRPQPGWDER